MSRVILFVLLCAFLPRPQLSCAQQPSDTTGSGGIRTVLEEQARAWNKGDIDGYMQGYWESDSMLFTSGGNIQRGWRAARDKYKLGYSTREAMGALTFSAIEIHPLSETSAWVFGHWLLERAKDHPHGVFTLVMRKFPEGWKIVHDHTSAEITKPPSK